MDPSDRRSVLMAATHQGRELVARLVAYRRASAEARFARLSVEERVELLRPVRSITEETP